MEEAIFCCDRQPEAVKNRNSGRLDLNALLTNLGKPS